MAGPLDLLGCPRGRTHQQRGRTSHPACRPVAQGEFRHAVREWCTVRRCHADGRGDLPDARPGPVRLPGRGLHREHGRPCRPPAPPRNGLIPGCLQATPDVAGPVTWCAFPTDPRERLLAHLTSMIRFILRWGSRTRIMAQEWCFKNDVGSCVPPSVRHMEIIWVSPPYYLGDAL